MIGERLVDRYELRTALGEGGMGVVYRAHDPLLDREVAVKMISASHSSEIDEERFRREAQLVARLDHRAIVPIFDFGRHGESLFFVMPLIQGQTLHQLIQDGELCLGAALEIGVQVAEALDHAAEQGVVHRDIKPENIMVRQSEDLPPRVWVMDFGLALGGRRTRITKTGNLPGTLAYLSPEYILSLDLDGRSDLYSLGTILYECLTGETPFDGGTQGSMLYRIVHEAPSPLSAAGFDPVLAEIVESCLEKNPGDRPQRGNDLAHALRGYRSTIEGSERAFQTLPLASETPFLTAPSLATVGREQELGQLHKALELASSGECTFLMIGGEAGVGKSHLLGQLEHLARTRGFRVYRGRFAPQEQSFPHHGLCELIQDSFRSRESGSSSTGTTDLGDLAPDLLRVFPVLGEIPAVQAALRSVRDSEGEAPSGILDAGLGDDRTRLFELLARVLIRIQGGRPTVYSLESLELAGASIDALQYILRRMGPTSTLVAGTFRSEEVSKRHPLRTLQRSFETDPRFLLMQLRPLEEEGSRQMLRALLSEAEGARSAVLPDEIADRVYSTCEGNPFFTHELVRSLRQSGELVLDEEGIWGLSGLSRASINTLPETIQQVIEARLERLPEDLLQVLRAASVLGRSFEFKDLEALVDDPDRADEAVEALLLEGVLEEERRGRGDKLSFSSGVLREVLHGQLSRRRRRSLHLEVATLLEKRWSAQLERVYPELVHHFSEGDDPVKTVTYALMLARRAAGAFAPQDTAKAARTALEFLDDYELDGGEVEGELRLLLSSALRLSGQLEGALREAGRAVDRWMAAGEEKAAAGAALAAAEIAWQLRRVDETRRWLRRGIDIARSAHARGRLHKLLTLAATVANLRGEHLQAKAFLDEVQSLIQEETSSTAVARGGALQIALPTRLTTRDPVKTFTVEDAEVLANVFDTLVAQDEQGHLLQCLSTGWWSPDESRSFRVSLRTGVVFSDGTRLDAAVVRKALLDACSRSPEPMPAAFQALDSEESHGGIEVCGEHEICFHLREPLPIFPNFLVDLRTSVAVRSEAGDLLGNGPFRIAATDDTRIVLERNPNTWRSGASLLDRLEFRTGLDSSSIARELRDGRLDIARDLTPEDLEAILKEPEIRSGLVEAQKRNVYFALIHHQGPLTHQPELRRVLTGVVRSQDIVWRTLGRFAQPATGLIPPGFLGHDIFRGALTLSRDEALETLISAGLLPPLRLRALVHPMFRDRYRAVLRALLETWAAFGIQVEILPSALADLKAAQSDSEGVDLLLGRWIPDFNDPDTLTHGLFHSRSGAYRGFYSSSALDQLLEKARQEPRESVRGGLYGRIEEHLAAQAVVLPLFHEIDYRIASPRVRGLRHLNAPPYVNYGEVWRVRDETSRGVRLGTGPLRVPLPATFESLEPAMALIVEPAEVVPNVFETLTRVEEGAGIGPNLAAEVRMSEDHRRVRIRLRDDVLFHDGRRLSAEDVRYSFERLLRTPFPGVEASLLPIRGARELAAGTLSELSGLQIDSALELRLELEEPMPLFPAKLSNPVLAIVARGTRCFDGNWHQGCVGTGPYRVARFEPGERVELEASPYYWRPGLPKSRRLVFELGIPLGEQAAELEAGRYSLAPALLPSDVESLRRNPRFASSSREAPAFCTYFLVLNSQRGPLADLGRRRALRQLLDPERLVRAALGRLGLPAERLISAGLLGHDPPSRRRGDGASSSSHAAAAAELAGLELEMSVHPVFRGQYRQVWKSLRHHLGQAGLVVRAEEGTLEQVLRQVQGGAVDLVAARRLAAYPDPDAFVGIFHSREGLFGNLLCSQGLDRLIEKGRRETDPSIRHSIYREIEHLLRREELVIPLFDEQTYCFVQPEIRGLRLRLAWPKIAYEELYLED